MNLTGVFRNDAILRQTTKCVRVSHVKEDELIITKAEWNYLPVPRTIIKRMWVELCNFVNYAKPIIDKPTWVYKNSITPFYNKLIKQIKFWEGI